MHTPCENDVVFEWEFSGKLYFVSRGAQTGVGFFAPREIRIRTMRVRSGIVWCRCVKIFGDYRSVKIFSDRNVQLEYGLSNVEGPITARTRYKLIYIYILRIYGLKFRLCFVLRLSLSSLLEFINKIWVGSFRFSWIRYIYWWNQTVVEGMLVAYASDAANGGWWDWSLHPLYYSHQISSKKRSNKNIFPRFVQIFHTISIFWVYILKIQSFP